MIPLSFPYKMFETDFYCKNCFPIYFKVNYNNCVFKCVLALRYLNYNPIKAKFELLFNLY